MVERSFIYYSGGVILLLAGFFTTKTLLGTVLLCVVGIISIMYSLSLMSKEAKHE